MAEAINGAAVVAAASGPVYLIMRLNRNTHKAEEAAVADLMLFCFHHAGGSARQYAGWTPHMPSWIRLAPIQLPGHGTQLMQRPLADWPGVVAEMLAQSEASGPGPARWAVFGHSMGALLALEFAHALRARTAVEPAWMGVAACRPPSARIPLDTAEPNWLQCPRGKVTERLRELGGTPAEVLDSPELLDVVLPAVRADLHLCAVHAPPPRPPLRAPLLALGADGDDLSEAELRGWAVETTGPCRTRMMPGDHFLVAREAGAIARLVAAELGRARTAALIA